MGPKRQKEKRQNEAIKYCYLGREKCYPGAEMCYLGAEMCYLSPEKCYQKDSYPSGNL
jgi:hypothetical protein